MNFLRRLTDKARDFYKYIEHPTTMALLLSFLCYRSMMTMEAEYDIVLRILCTVICYVCTLLLSKKKETFSQILKEKSAKATFIVSWLYFTFTIWGAWYLDQDSVISLYQVLMYIVVAAWIYPIMAVITLCTDKAIIRMSESETKAGEGFSIRTKLIFGIIIVALCSILLIAFNPAITSPDSANCYEEAYKIILGKPIGDDHPFFYKFLLSLIMRINTSISLIIMVQVVFYSVICVKSIDFLKKIGASTTSCVLLFILFGCAYNTLMQMVTLWKDIPYAVSMLWLTVLLAESVTLPVRGKREILWYAELVVAGTIVGFTRHGGLIPVYGALAVLFIGSKQKKRIIIGILAVIVATLFVSFPLKKLLKVNNLSNSFKYSALLSDIEYVYYNGGELEESGLEFMDTLNARLPETYRYNPWYGSSLYPPLEDESTLDFIKIYLRTFAKNPALMTKGILVRNNYLWTIVRPEQGGWSCVARMSETILPDDAEIRYPSRKNNILTDLFDKVISYVSYIPVVNMIYWRIGLYTFFILASFLLVALRKRKLSYVVPFAPILLNCFVLLVACVWPNYRYYWPNALLCGFLLIYCMAVLARKNEETL